MASHAEHTGATVMLSEKERMRSSQGSSVGPGLPQPVRGTSVATPLRHRIPFPGNREKAACAFPDTAV